MKKIKYTGVAAAILLSVAPVITTSTTALADTTAQANTQVQSDTPDQAQPNAQAQTNAPAGADTYSAQYPLTQSQISTYNWFTNMIGGVAKKPGQIAQSIIKQAVNKVANDAETAIKNEFDKVVSNAEKGINNAVITIAGKVIPITPRMLQMATKGFVGGAYDDKHPMPDFTPLINVYGQHLNAAQFKALNMKQYGVTPTALNIINIALQHKMTIVFGNQGETANDLAERVSRAKQFGRAYPFSIPFAIFKDGQQQPLVSGQLMYVNNSVSSVATSSLQIKYSDTVNARLGESTEDDMLSHSLDVFAMDQNGSPVQFSAKLGDYYSSEDDAWAQDGSTYQQPIFNKDKTVYYQPVTLTFANKLDLDKVHDSDGITVNGDEIKGSAINGNTLTLVRKIAVGMPTDNKKDKDKTPVKDGWVFTKHNTVVTVLDDDAPLVQDDDSLDNRAIKAHTPWRSDQYRTNPKTGKTEYRVSTHEWVDSALVTETQAAADQANGTSLGSVTNLQGHNVIKLNGNNFVYKLYKLDGGNASRGLAGGSAWFTDKCATDDQGNKYYRISTDEWVKLDEGVTLN